MKIFLILVIFCCAPAYNAIAQFNQNNARSLFSDVRAYRVGDAVTITIVEETIADNSASTQQNRSTSIGGDVGVNVGSTSVGGTVDLGTDNKFTGSGQTSRNERFRTRLSARVISVEQNGNLKIEGKRTFQLNGENQSITLTGFIRPVDIQNDNSILSYNIMDLNIVYQGEGSLTETQEPGLITKFLRLLF